MDIKNLGIKTYKPTFNGNAEDPDGFSVRHRTMRRAWAVEGLELAHDAAILRDAAADTDRDIKERREKMKEAVAMNADYIKRFLSDHLVSVEGLTNDGEPVDVAGFVKLCEDVPELGEEIAAHISSGGRLSEDEAKN